MSLTQKIRRENEGNADRREAEASRRGLLGEESAELNGSSRRLPSNCLLDYHSACVGTCPYTHYAHHLPSSGSVHYEDAHSMKRTDETEEATSAPACTSMATWEGDTCQARHTFHYHHHYYHYEWPSGEGGPIRSSHACPARVCCCAMKLPHDFSSHGGPPINCPVNISGPSPAPSKPCPASTSQSKQKQTENDLNAAEAAAHAAAQASPLTVFKTAHHCSRRLPPFPSLHASPYVLCQHCSRLLLLPPGTLLSPPPAPLILDCLLYVKLKCGFCLNISKFSTRYLYTASSSSLAEGICSPPQSMPSCITSNAVMQESSNTETEESINGIFHPALESNCVNSKVLAHGNGEHNLELKKIETETPLNGFCKRMHHIETKEPAHGVFGESTQSKLGETGALAKGKSLHTQDNVIETGESPNGTCGDLAPSKHVETSALLICECAHTQAVVLETVEPVNGMSGDLTQSKYVETGVLLNGKCAHTEEIVIETVQHVNGICGDVAQPEHLEMGTLVNGHCGQTSKEKDNGVCDDTSDQNEIKMRVLDDGAIHDPRSDREQEITAYSSVQDWVDSLSVEIGHESDNQLRGPLNGLSDCGDGLDKFASSRRRSRLHQHFGYSSPSELFEKVLFSEDEEIKARTETNSTASSSFSSNNACQPSETKSSPVHVQAPSLQSWEINTGKTDSSGVMASNEKEAQRSLAGLLKKSLKMGSLLPGSPKTRVVVNGHTLSSAVIKQAEERAGKLRPGFYWYDCKAGFWGVEGGPCLGILPPYIEELNYPMTKQCSNGDTQVYLNGRELHVKDLAVLSQRGLSRKAGRAYTLGFDGVLVDESTGLQLKNLGKLAPTVERKGKGFGMFTAVVLQSKASAVH